MPDATRCEPSTTETPAACARSPPAMYSARSVSVMGNGPLRISSAAGSVDRRKQQRILRTAQLYLQRHPELACLPCRFDVIAFEPRQSGSSLEIRWIPGAFTA